MHTITVAATNLRIEGLERFLHDFYKNSTLFKNLITTIEEQDKVTAMAEKLRKYTYVKVFYRLMWLFIW